MKELAQQPVVTEDTHSGKVYFAGFMPRAPADPEAFRYFVGLSGRKPASVVWYEDWSSPFPLAAAENAVQLDLLPHITWEPQDWREKEDISLDDIVGGKKDAVCAILGQGC